MAEGRPGASAQAEESRRRLARIALAALLVVAVLAGVRGEVRPLSFRTPQRGHDLVTGILPALLVLAIVTAIVICVIVLRRRPSHPADVTLAAGDDEENLREAVESGQAALRGLDDARAAIIACYLAMERSLAQAGAARDVAETPDELLARAADAGLVRGGAAGRLTALFYEARFSSHPLPASARTAAQRALSE